jgi:hypothetical protein
VPYLPLDEVADFMCRLNMPDVFFAHSRIPGSPIGMRIARENLILKSLTLLDGSGFYIWYHFF